MECGTAVPQTPGYIRPVVALIVVQEFLIAEVERFLVLGGGHDIRARRGTQVAAVALANKNARILWALLATGEVYRQAA